MIHKKEFGNMGNMEEIKNKFSECLIEKKILKEAYEKLIIDIINNERTISQAFEAEKIANKVIII